MKKKLVSAFIVVLLLAFNVLGTISIIEASSANIAIVGRVRAEFAMPARLRPNVAVTIASTEANMVISGVLRANMDFVHYFGRFPPGEYVVYAEMTRRIGGDERTWDHPRYILEFPRTITIPAGEEVFELEIEILEKPVPVDPFEGLVFEHHDPRITVGEPPLPPEEHDPVGVFWRNFWRNFFGGWFTIILVLVGIVLTAALVHRKYKYQD